MKHLRIEVNGSEWVNGDFAEISFTDGPGGIKVEGKTARAPGGGGGSLLEMLTGASRQRTAEMTREMRNSITKPEPVAEVVNEVIEAEPVEQH